MGKIMKRYFCKGEDFYKTNPEWEYYIGSFKHFPQQTEPSHKNNSSGGEKGMDGGQEINSTDKAIDLNSKNSK